MCRGGKEKKERQSLDGRRNELHDLNSGAVSELYSVNRVRGQPASMPHSVTLILDGMYSGLTYYGTPTPVHKCSTGRREATNQGNGLVLGV